MVSGYARVTVDWLDSHLRLAFVRSGLPQRAAAVGVHVDFGLCHLLLPEMAHLVEGPKPNHSSGLALGSLPSGLAGHGRRGFLGCESTCANTCMPNLAVGDHRNNSRCASALDCGAICSGKRTSSARVGGNVRSGPAPSLRYLPNRGPAVAELWRRCKTHHVCPSRLRLPE